MNRAICFVGIFSFSRLGGEAAVVGICVDFPCRRRPCPPNRLPIPPKSFSADSRRKALPPTPYILYPVPGLSSRREFSRRRDEASQCFPLFFFDPPYG